MRQKILCILFAALFVCCEGISRGQGSETYIRAAVDSLDRIEPQPLRTVKPLGRAFTINVKTQTDFDRLNSTITEALQAGETNIRVKIGNGKFRYHENHILRRDEKRPEVSITVEGKRRTVLTSDGGSITVGGEIQECWQEMVYADGQIVVVDAGRKWCRIPYNNHLTKAERARIKKVQVTEWFRAPVYEVEKVDDGGVYFVATDLQETAINGRKGYNVNYDYLYREKTPRFRLYDSGFERQCDAARWLCLERDSYRQIVLKNLHFVSNMAGGPLMTLGNLKAEAISISGCTFEYIRGTVLSASTTGNIIFDKNVVRHTAGDELRFLNNCENVRVTGNLFENCGKTISNTVCVNCREATYYIANNTFCDFGYGAIGVGVWHGFEKKNPSRGIIEHNEIYFTPEYFANAWKHMLMDSGAIYTWTQNDQVIIRYNYIHDYIGMKDNRGIFCDDGASNFTITGNTILRVANSYCIDSRRIKDQHPEKFKNNVNITITDNIVDGSIRFEGREEEGNQCVYGGNTVRMAIIGKVPGNKISNVLVLD